MERKRDYMTVQELTENEKYKFWYFKIKECKESGLSVKDFCDKNNIKPSTYYNYQQKIRNILCDQINENSYKNEVSLFLLKSNHTIMKRLSLSREASKLNSIQIHLTKVLSLF